MPSHVEAPSMAPRYMSPPSARDPARQALSKPAFAHTATKTRLFSAGRQQQQPVSFCFRRCREPLEPQEGGRLGKAGGNLPASVLRANATCRSARTQLTHPVALQEPHKTCCPAGDHPFPPGC